MSERTNAPVFMAVLPPLPLLLLACSLLHCKSGEDHLSHSHHILVTMSMDSPELTWRDIQHLCVRASLHINPDDPDWQMTSVGRPYSYKYGYGALDAWTYVELARTWKLVKPQAWVDLPQVEIQGSNITPDGVMSGGTFISANGVDSKITVTSGVLKENNFESLEHVTVKVWISHARRGDVEVQIVSPNGITSVLAAARRFDEDDSGFPGWQFMSVKHWYDCLF
jgi:kexin